MLTGLVISILVFGVAYIIAATRKPSSALEGKPSRLASFAAVLQPADVLKVVSQFALQHGYKVALVDDASGVVVLSDSASLISLGFFYPVIAKSQDGKGSLVEVGIKSKSFQFGPLVTSKHSKCFEGIKAAVLAAA